MQPFLKSVIIAGALSASSFVHAQLPSYEWAGRFGNNSQDICEALTVDNSGNVYSVGRFSNSVDFDPGPGVFNMNGGTASGYIQKLDANGNFVWAKTVLSTLSQISTIAVGPGGEVYAGGYFRGSADMDPGPGSFPLTSNFNGNPHFDAFILKLDAAGNFVWAKQFVGTTLNGDGVRGLALDAAGNVYATGYFETTVDFDPGPASFNMTAAGGHDIFVTKLTSSGNFVWAKRIGNASSDIMADFPVDVEVDTNSNVVVTGHYTGTVDFDPGAGTSNLVSAGNEDAFVFKLSSTGDYVWAKKMGGAGNDQATGITIDPSGNIIVAGSFSAVADFDPGPGIFNMTPAGSINSFATKLDNSGNLIWAKQYTGGTNFADGISSDNSGNIHLTGRFSGITDFNPGTGTANLNSQSGYSVYISRLDASGNYSASVGIIATTPNCYAEGIATEKSGTNVYVAGRFPETVDFDPAPLDTARLTSAGDLDVFVGKYSYCQPTASTLNITACNSYTLNAQTYTTGGTYSQTRTNHSGCDSVITLNLTINNSNAHTINATACNSYTLNTQTYTASGTYMQTLTNHSGCDSVITLNLTINNSNAHTITATACNSYTLNTQTYTASGTYTQTLTNHSGCDSVITLNLTINNSNAHTINATACNSYTLNAQNYTASGTYTQTLTNHSGCDSVITLNLTINNSNAHTINATACNSYTLNTQTYTASGTYTQTLTNLSGCDSVITLNLTINNSNSHTITATACNSYTLNAQNYTASGTYTQTLTNHSGCDSVITLNLTINNSNAHTINATACNSYTLNAQNYTASGTYMQTLTNHSGCDSVITLNLTINSAEANVTQSGNMLTANADADTYQWIDCNNGNSAIAGATAQVFTATANGSYAVVVSANNCSDTSACFTVNTVGIEQNLPGSVQVYPNPSSGIFNLAFGEETKKVSLAISDINGRTIGTGSVNGAVHVLDLSGQAPGIYFVRVSAPGGISTVKLIRN